MKRIFDPSLRLTTSKGESDTVKWLNEKGNKAMTKAEALSLLISVVKEQQRIIDDLHFKVAELRGEVEP